MDLMSLVNPAPAPGNPKTVGHFNLVEMVEQDARLQAEAETRRHRGGYMAHMGDTPSNLGSGLRGAYIVVAPQPEYKVGDVVVVPGKTPGGKIHPIVAVDPKKGVFTKGTFNRQPDGWTELSKVRGKLIRGFREK